MRILTLLTALSLGCADAPEVVAEPEVSPLEACEKIERNALECIPRDVVLEKVEDEELLVSFRCSGRKYVAIGPLPRKASAASGGVLPFGATLNELGCQFDHGGPDDETVIFCRYEEDRGTHRGVKFKYTFVMEAVEVNE